MGSELCHHCLPGHARVVRTGARRRVGATGEPPAVALRTDREPARGLPKGTCAVRSRWLLLLTVCLGLLAGAAETPPGTKPRLATVRLRDDSQVVGRILGLKNGLYEIESSALGRITVQAEEVESITFRPAGDRRSGAGRAPGRELQAEDDAVPAESGVAGEALTLQALNPDDPLALDAQALVKTIAGDPDLLKAVTELQSDPEIQAVLRDPEIMKAVETGDFARLLTSPKVRSLVENEKVQAVSEKVRHSGNDGPGGDGDRNAVGSARPQRQGKPAAGARRAVEPPPDAAEVP